MPLGVDLHIPNALGPVSPGVQVLPDSEVGYSPAAIFDVETFVRSAGGLLASYQEEVPSGIPQDTGTGVRSAIAPKRP